VAPDGTPGAPDPLRTGNLLLRAGHWRSLCILEDAPRVRETLALYERALGHPVYLRPTDGGLTVIALDPAAPAMVGVGGAEPGACCIDRVPPDRTAVDASVRDYRAKVEAMRRSSTEERFVVARIRVALTNETKLRADLLFLHQEWRFPDAGKIDLLAIDAVRGQLVVVEAKKGEASATRERDAKGRTASEQVAAYVAQIAHHARECSPFFTRLALALARVYRNGDAVAFDPSVLPRWEVWWPDGCLIGPMAPPPVQGAT
jgi:hypothetical protein